MSTFLNILQMAVAAFLFYSCFCRLVRTTTETISEIRHAIWFLALTAGMVFGAPILPLLVPQIQWTAWTTPRWVWMGMLFAIAILQFVTSRHWRHGVPESFQKG